MIRRWTNRRLARPRRRPDRRQLGAEMLESRRLLAGNLAMVSAHFVNSDRVPIGTPTVGEQVFLEANWVTTNLNPSDQYVVRFNDSTAGLSPLVIDSATFTGTPGVAVPFSTFTGGWYASAGQHHIEITLDAGDQITETTELDNRSVVNYVPLPPDLPVKLVQPLSGEQNVDWSIVNYPDLWPLSPDYRDYQCDDIFLPNSRKCGSFSFDGSQGTDFQLANFAAMDGGQPVYSVLGGTVTPGVTGEVINGIKGGDTMATISRNLGDINGDSLPDYLFTGPSAAVGIANQVGEAYVLYGQPGGFESPLEMSDLLSISGGDGTRGFVIHGMNAGDQTAASVSATGDFNADGLIDMVIGAPQADPIGFNSGRAYVLFGRATGFPAEVNLKSLLAVNGGNGSQGVVFNGAVSGDNAGQSVAIVSDLNGDGYQDLAIGAPRARNPSFQFAAGQTFVVYGGPGPWPAEYSLSNLRIANGANGTKGFMAYGSLFEASGSGVSSAGDLNGDGVGDLAIGAPGFGFGSATGDIYVLYGKTAADQLATPFPAEFGLSNLLVINLGDGTKGFVIHGEAGSSIGRQMRPVVDLNGDGFGEFFIGATTGGAQSEGQLYILHGAAANFPAEFNLENIQSAFGGDGTLGTAITGANQFELVGTSFDVVGDMNGDTLPDLLIGAPGGNVAYLLFGVTGGWGADVSLATLGLFGGTAGVTFVGINRNDRTGQSVSAAGDLNGDGRADMLIGASQADPNGSNSGQAYIVYGQAAPFQRIVELSLLASSRSGRIEIDHGNGWITRYEHLDPDSITVHPGDVVGQGEVLGLVGSRADTTAQLHFEIEHNKALVETNLDPTAYWLAPLEYQGFSDRQALDAGVTNLDPTADLEERPSDIRYLHPTYTGNLNFWTRISHLNPRDEYQVNWHLPNGSVLPGPYHCLSPKLSPIFGSQCDAFDSSPIHMGLFSESINLQWRQFAGDWFVTLTINGQERARVFFSIVSSPIEPAMRVTYGTALVGNPVLLDGRTTPINFGTIDQNDVRPQQTFTIENHGSTALHVANVIVPSGFHLVGVFPTLVNPSERGQFVLEMDTNLAGPQFGAVRILNDDANESDFNFYVAGDVVGSNGATDPRLTLPGPTAYYLWGQNPAVLDPQANVFDVDSPVMSGGQLQVELIGNVVAEDRVGIRHQGTGNGQVGVAGSEVSYEGTIVGILTGGAGSTPLRVDFNAQATLAAVKAILAQVTYASVSLDPGTAPKFVRYTLIDNNGHVSNHPIKMILPAPSVLNALPTVASVDVTPTVVTIPDNITITANAVADADGFVAAVEFYVEANNLAGLQTGPGGDTRLATDTVGGDGWSTTLSSSLLAVGNRTLYAQAIDDRLARGQPVTTALVVNPRNLPPEIVFLAANPPDAIQPDPIALSANGVSDPDGVVARVDFYLETNSQAGLQTGPGGDTLIGTDTSILAGWTATLVTDGLADGPYAAYAQAVDTLGGVSIPATLSVQIGTPPPPGSYFLLSDLLAASGGDGSEGQVINGLATGDELGSSISSAGDLNGDGLDDFVLGVPSADLTGPARNDAGQAYVIFGTVLASTAEVNLALLNGANGFQISGLRTGDGAGKSVRSAGDLNGDGLSDLIIGAATADPSTGVDAGEAYVVFGRALGFPAVLDLATLNGTTGFRMAGVAPGDLLGVSVAGTGDVNGDGFADLIVGASGASPGTPQRAQAGKAFLLFGSKAGFPASVNLNLLNGATGVVLEGITPTGHFGMSTSTAGDLNGDGFADLVVGAQDGPTGGGPNKGVAYIVFGHANPWNTPLEVDTLGGIHGFRVDGLNTGDRLGSSVAPAGDVNGDGVDDLILGAPGADPGSPVRTDAGAAYVLFGKTTGFADTIDLLTLDGSNGFEVEGAAAGDALGVSVAGGGDVNSDGFDDLIVGASLATPGTPARNAAGVVYVIFGHTAPHLAKLGVTTLNGQNGFRLEGVASDDHGGFGVAGGLDANGDGFDDLLVGAPQASPGNPARAGAGQAYLFLGRNFTSSVSPIGDENANTLAGNPASNAIVGGANSDIIAGMGGIDVLRGGQGNDVLGVSDLTFRRVDGGRGRDTLRLDGAGLVLNLAQLLATKRVSQIEIIDLTGSGSNELVLEKLSVLNASDTSNQLIVKRNSGDAVNIGTGWTLTALQVIDGVTYNVFQQDAAELLVAAVPEGTPWQNPANPLDTTNDGSVAPSDALAGINYLNLHPGAGDPLPNPPLPGFAPPPLGAESFYDVNGDGFASAIDALLVINFLNAIAGGEGEASDPADSSALAISTPRATSNDFFHSIVVGGVPVAAPTAADFGTERPLTAIVTNRGTLVDAVVSQQFDRGDVLGETDEETPESNRADGWNELLDTLAADQLTR